MKEIFIVIILSCLLFGCAATDVTPVTKGFALVEEEKVLWRQSEESQETLKKSDMLYDNPELSAYINEVAVKLWPENITQQDQLTLDVLQDLGCTWFPFITHPNPGIWLSSQF